MTFLSPPHKIKLKNACKFKQILIYRIAIIKTQIIIQFYDRNTFDKNIVNRTIYHVYHYVQYVIHYR